jgi:hypothetical protein
MRLEGSINRFNLAGVLQFLAQNAATGVLEVRDFEEYGYVYLVEGRVEGISLPITDELLGTRLLKAGCLTEEQLREALMEDASLTPGQRRLQPLGQRLVDKGFTSESSIREVMKRQVYDEVFELAHWRSGVFCYDEPDEMPVFQVKIQANVQALLLDAQRRIDQGERACKSASPGSSENEVCFGCPIASECTDAIKAKYLKHDVCLWRKMTAVIDDRTNAPRQSNELYRSKTDEAKSVLEASLDWKY